MKKAIVLMAMALFAFVSCDKEIAMQSTDNSGAGYSYVFNARILQTKAIQREFVDGENIFVFSDDKTGCIKLTYNASEGVWTSTQLILFHDPLAEGQKLRAVYVPFAKDVTPVRSGNGWKIGTGEGYYGIDDEVIIEGIHENEISGTIDIVTEKTFFQLYFDKSFTHIGGKTLVDDNSEKLVLESNYINVVESVTLLDEGESRVSEETLKSADPAVGSKTNGHVLSVAGDTGVVFYGKPNELAKDGGEFDIVRDGKAYYYTFSSLSNKAYNVKSAPKYVTLAQPYNVGSNGTPTYVRFTTANLRVKYEGGSSVWAFHDNQYDVVGNGNKLADYQKGGWYDLFGWGATSQAASGRTATSWWTNGDEFGNGDNKFRTDINSNNAELAADDDWGANEIAGVPAKTFRTLSKDEWQNLNANYTFINSAIGSRRGGVICASTSYKRPNYSTEEWAEAEKNGALFLPAAGYMNGDPSTGADVINEGMFYWSRTLSTIVQDGIRHPWGFGNYSGYNVFNTNLRQTCRAVRLVKYL